MKAAIIIATGLIVTMAIYIYFSPYQSCVRSMKAEYPSDTIGYTQAESICARNSN